MNVSISDFREWRWAPCAGLVLGSLAFVGLSLAFIPDHVGNPAPPEEHFVVTPPAVTAAPLPAPEATPFEAPPPPPAEAPPEPPTPPVADAPAEVPTPPVAEAPAPAPPEPPAPVAEAAPAEAASPVPMSPAARHSRRRRRVPAP